jgi:serine/threonine-protein kinase
MVCKVAQQHDFVKVLDFGLAKSIVQDGMSQVTVDGVTAGTPGYMAPEVALGNPDVDGRADLYAVGCLGYVLLTGTLVFPDTNPMSMALKHVQAPPDPPSQRTELPIPPDLERLILQCLEKKPENRPSSARELRERLLMSGAPAWTEHDAASWWEHHLPHSSSLRSFAQSTMRTPPVVQKV